MMPYAVIGFGAGQMRRSCHLIMFVGLLCSMVSACKRRVQRQIDHALRAYDPSLLEAFTANRGLLRPEAEHSSVYEFMNDQTCGQDIPSMV